MTIARLALITATLAITLAAPARADTVIRLGGPASSGLTASALKPAKKIGRNVSLPIRSATPKLLRHSGSLTLRTGRRSVTLARLQFTIGRKPTVRAALGGGLVQTLFTVNGTPSKGAGLIVTQSGATAIQRALKLQRRPSGRIGTITVTTSAKVGTPGTKTPVNVDVGTPTSPVTPGTPGEQGPASLTRPATAVDITTASMTWHVRDSFIRYIAAGQGTSVASGATAAAPTVEPGTDAPLVYEFQFAFKDGWTDQASGISRLRFTGKVTFSYANHDIKLTAADPEVEISGSASRAIFVTGNIGQPAARGVLMDLDPSTGSSRMNGTLPPGTGNSVFNDMYLVGDPFGWIGITTSTPSLP